LGNGDIFANYVFRRVMS